MRLAPIIARLQDQCPALRQVIPALTGAVPASYPAAYVLPLADAADENRLMGAHSQRITAKFAVEIMVKHAAQAASGGPAGEQLEAVREEVRAALKGWSPGPEFTPIDYLSGRLVNFDAGLAVWREEYRTRFDQRN
jgi:hypothetical protein